MIDRDARNGLAQGIRHFVGCFKTNFEYDDFVFDIVTKDEGVLVIRDDIWFLYDDIQKHKLVGKWALDNDKMDVIKRMIVFLKSDCDYEWQKWPLYYRIIRPFMYVASIGILPKKYDHYFNGRGDLNAWPFLTLTEYRIAKKSPAYLSMKI